MRNVALVGVASLALGIAIGRALGRDPSPTTQGIPQTSEIRPSEPAGAADRALEAGTPANEPRALLAPPDAKPEEAQDPESESGSLSKWRARLDLPEHPPEFYANLEGAARDEFLRDNRLQYLITKRIHIEETLAKLEALDPEHDFARFLAEAQFLLTSSACLILDLQGRDHFAWEPGEPYSIGPVDERTTRVMDGPWIYELSAEEFPEFFELKNLWAELGGTKDKGSPPPSFQITTHERILFHAYQAMERFDWIHE